MAFNMQKISAFFDDLIGSITAALVPTDKNAFGREVIEWQNSAGQIVRGRRELKDELEGAAQSCIDSYASYSDEVTPEKCRLQAKSIEGQFRKTAAGIKVVTDINGGNGKYRFTYQEGRDQPRKVL